MNSCKHRRVHARLALSLFLPSRVRFDDVDTRFPSAVLFFSPLFPPFPCSFLLNLPVSCKFYFSAAAFNITTVLSSFFRCQIIFTLTYTHAQTHTLAQTHIVARENSYINTHKYTYIYIYRERELHLSSQIRHFYYHISFFF